VVEHVEFHDDGDSGSANPFVTDKWRDESADFTDAELEHGNGCDIVYRSGIDVNEFYDNGVEPECLGSFRFGKWSCGQRHVLLGSERDECRRYKRVVERVELYHHQ
jgi:hypothetical protein